MTQKPCAGHFFFFFVAQLPSHVRSILALQEFSDVHDLAKAADRIVEAQNLSQNIEVSAASVRRQPPRFQRSVTTRSKPSQENCICTCHQRFGPKAQNCRPGCIFAKLLPLNASPSQTAQENATAGRH